MIGLRGIAGRRPDTGIFFSDALLVRQLFVRRVSPELAPYALMHALGEGFSQAIGERLHHDRAVIVVVAGKASGNLLLLGSRRDDEAADIIRLAAVERRDEVGERQIGAALAAFRQLLAQGEERRELVAA